MCLRLALCKRSFLRSKATVFKSMIYMLLYLWGNIIAFYFDIPEKN